MSGKTVLVLAVLIAGLAGAGPASAKSPANRYIVVLEEGVDVTSVIAQHERLAGTDVLLTYRHALSGYAARLTPSALEAVRRDVRVAYVARDREIELSEQDTPTGVRRIGGPVVRPAGLAGAATGTVGVAVIDTGIELDHPDLANVVPGRNCISRLRLPDDDNGHGTHVAGTIAAQDNGFGVVGVDPQATLFAVKTLAGNGWGTASALVCAVDWVTAHAAVVKVANLSLGWRGIATPSRADCTNPRNDPVHTAICRSTKLGVTYVAAAGNSRVDASAFLPAAYDEVIAVSAIADSDGAPGGLGPNPSCRAGEIDDTFASFSNYGAVIDIAAPGVCIYSTSKDGGYATKSGTSMAAPHVAGAAALYVQSHPFASRDEVLSALVAAAEPGPIAGDPDGGGEGVVHVSQDVGGLPGLPPLPPLPMPPAPAPPAPPGLPPLPLPPLP